MKTKILNILFLFLISLATKSAIAYESFSHTILLLPHEPVNSEPWVKTITNQEDWESFFYSTMATATYPVGQAPVAPVLDFESYQIITGGLGIKPSSGYTLAVDKVIETDDALNINILSVSPGSNCFNLQFITYPSLTFLIKKTDKEIKYNITSVVNSCEE